MDRAPYAFITFVSMIIVTYEYIVLTLVHRYSYHLRDTVILFGLGFAQIVPVFFLHEPPWWWVGNILFCSAGVVAFTNESIRNKDASFGFPGIYPMTKAKLRFDIGLSILATIWCCSAAGVLFKVPTVLFQGSTISIDPLWFLLPMLVVQATILLRERKYIRNIHAKLGFSWDDEGAL